jgi:alkylation response protein AidB-like acyl-CoA dehydrogenase
MDVRLTETQEMLKAAAREFLAESCTPAAVRQARHSDDGFSSELWGSMAELGWQGLALPERAGGSGMAFLDLCLLVEELGRACVPSPFLDAIAGCAISLGTSGREEADRLAMAIAAGDSLVVPALHGARDAQGTESLPTLGRKNDTYTLMGAAMFVPYARQARLLLCSARSADTPRRDYLLVIPVDAQGVLCTPLISMGDQRPHEVRFDGVAVHAEQILYEGEAATEARQRVIRHIEVARCCDVLGALQWVLDDTVAYAKERKQFGQPIGSFQSLQHYCADMRIMLDGLRTAAYYAAWQLGEECDAERSVAVACAFAHRVVPAIMGLAHQIHGAMGATQEHDLHLYTTHALAPAHGLAPVDEYREIVLQG